MSEATDAAQVLEEAADWLLVHGRCRDALTGPGGTGCVMYAVGMGGAKVTGDQFVALSHPLLDRAWTALCSYLGRSPVQWNYTASDDAVRDALLLVAKDLRNGEAAL